MCLIYHETGILKRLSDGMGERFNGSYSSYFFWLLCRVTNNIPTLSAYICFWYLPILLELYNLALLGCFVVFI